jgi:hypothetical protein
MQLQALQQQAAKLLELTSAAQQLAVAQTGVAAVHRPPLQQPPRQQQQQLQAQALVLAGVVEVAAGVQLLAAVAAGQGVALLLLQLQWTLVPAWLLTSGVLCVRCWGCAWCGCHRSSGARAWLPSCWMPQGALGLLLYGSCRWSTCG